MSTSEAMDAFTASLSAQPVTTTSTATTETFYMGRMTLPALISFWVFTVLMVAWTVFSCWWDCEYERCAVEPNEQLEVESETEDDVDPSCRFPIDHSLSRSIMDSTRSLRRINPAALKHQAMLEAASTITASRSERVPDDTQESGEKGAGSNSRKSLTGPSSESGTNSKKLLIVPAAPAPPAPKNELAQSTSKPEPVKKEE